MTSQRLVDMVRTALAEDPNYTYGAVLPLAQRKSDKAMSLAIPGLLRDALMGTAELVQGPEYGENLSPEAVASMIGPGSPAGKSIVVGPGARFFTRMSEKPTIKGGLVPSDMVPRKEISDELARLTSKGVLRSGYASPNKYELGEILEHPELFSNYPEMMDSPVSVVKPGGGILGSFDPGTKGFILAADEEPKNTTATLLHEIQHYIQDEEGMSQGANVEMFLPPEYEHFNRAVPNLLLNQNISTSLLNDFVAELAKTKQQAFNKYKTSAGEVEARAVQNKYLQQHQSPMSIEEGPKGWEIIEPSNLQRYPELPTPYDYMDVDDLGSIHDSRTPMPLSPTLKALLRSMEESLRGR